MNTSSNPGIGCWVDRLVSATDRLVRWLKGSYFSETIELAEMEYEKDFQRLKTRGTKIMTETDGWKVSSKSKENLKIETKSSELYNCTINRMTITIKVPVNVIRDTFTLLPGNRRKEWDTDVKEVIELKRFSDKKWLQITRSNGLGKGIISPREFVDLCCLEEFDDGFLLTGGSIDYPEIQSDDKYVRGFSGAYGFRVDKDPSKPGYSRLISATEMDFKGKIPRALIDATISTVLVSSVANWLKYLEKLGYQP
ncbi:unnamed protein product [Lymnaea stagnalis]|uniref:START domain-containing protein n=1 Tax=Lymnaea stagnalis TaxID=6523 RepID=A0AAV2H074_LYMST